MKKLFSLLLFLLSIISFGYCSNVSSLITKISEGTMTLNGNDITTLIDFGNSNYTYGTYCLKVDSMSVGNGLKYGYYNTNTSMGGIGSLIIFWNNNMPAIGCIKPDQRYLMVQNGQAGGNTLTFTYTLFKLDDLLAENLPVMSSSECKLSYNLVDSSELSSCQSSLGTCSSDLSSCQSSLGTCPEDLSSCNSNYNQCITDYGTCSSSLNYCYYDLGNCRAGVCSGNISTNLFINNIQYPINSNLFVNVPTEFDYNYSMTGNDSLIDIEYKVDSEYIEGIINTQSTLPNNVDFNNIITNVLPAFVPGLVIILFIYFVFRFIKKIF